jgi:hypothetical protein
MSVRRAARVDGVAPSGTTGDSIMAVLKFVLNEGLGRARE